MARMASNDARVTSRTTERIALRHDQRDGEQDSGDDQHLVAAGHGHSRPNRPVGFTASSSAMGAYKVK